MTVAKFTKLYGEFLADLQRVFPDRIVGDIKVGMKTGFTFFIKNSLPYMTYISNADEDWLVSQGGGMGILMLIDGVSFADVFGDERCNEATKNVIWTYLHSLYVLTLNVDRKIIDTVLKGEGSEGEGDHERSRKTPWA